MHIVFFNRSFYPDTAATGQLLTELCQSLVADFGCRVSVVTGPPLTPARTSEVRGPTCPPKRNGRRRTSEVQRLTSEVDVGHRTSVLGHRRGGVFSRERYAGINILRASGTRLPKQRVVGRFTNYVSYFASACYAGLRLDRPDVVVALTDPPIIGLAAYLAARRFGVPLVMSFRDVFPEVARLLEGFRSDAIEAALGAVNRFLVRKAACNVTLGDTMRRKLIAEKGAPAERTIVIPDWADCEAIKPGPKRNPFSEQHGLHDAFVVMHSGNIGLSQGLEHLVAAAAHLNGYPDIQIVFVGDGVKRPALEAQARSGGLGNVRFLPYQPVHALHDSFAAADVFVVSLRPGLAGYIVPSKLYGILAVGRPYIAAVEDDCEAAAIGREHACGVFARYGHPEDIAARVLEFYRDRQLAEAMGASARRAALLFDRRPQVDAYHRLFTSLVPAPRGARAKIAAPPLPDGQIQ